ncbi:MAG: sodium:proton antiporter [Bacteroidetes bacterium GWF2_41_61]|nr:MAG: sodium:proton antiporter [Bacteroidetes bacterium GWE2_40_15]OFY32129.1 MAG: sodium:proton antiporter [Bacteroidetes bacterium GWF2_41_61]OFY90324.1 MAG: sodium:proton antiporter [Bacteroidetes bacterium RIFOXYA12_FULL_40_10]HBG23579.1 sodium:proton antiporter [Rikenellaceae bacterium]HBZ26278.1 sodium:proton antiporter [Rikenellaceae bacterium]
MIIVFIVGYVCIAMEHKIKIDKAAVALLMAGVMWVIYIVLTPLAASGENSTSFAEFIANNQHLKDLSIIEQSRRFIVDFQLIEYLGDVSSTLFFLIGAMTIVELIDANHGFDIITRKIQTKDKRKLLWIIAGIAFVMSSVLDNLTTSIVMVTLVKKMIPNYKERWVFASMIIIAANSGGAWSPIGDVTTIMLWIKGRISSLPLIKSLLLPSLISTLVPLIFVTRLLKGGAQNVLKKAVTTVKEDAIGRRESITILVIGVLALLFVPVFKYFTGLPPFLGVLTSLAIIWIYTEILFSRARFKDSLKNRVTTVIKKIDTTTILFFLGILLSVLSLQATGVLNIVGNFLNEKTQNIYLIDMAIGALSSVVDNVPLVAVAMGMYPVIDPATLSTIANPEFMQNFVMDGTFWQFLAYCSGVGGSMLIIGSAAGVVVMGLEKIRFNWYLKHISLLAVAGYVAGALTYIAFN